MTSIPVEICRISSNNFNCIISKTKDFFCNFYCFSQTYIKFTTFQKKKWVSLGRLFNTLAVYDKYSPRNMQNFQQQLQLHYLKNKTFFLQFLLLFSNLHQIYNLSRKKVSLLVSVFPKLLTQKEVVTWMAKTSRSRTPFRYERVHEFQTLSKPARNHHYPIVPWIWDKLSWKKFRLVKFEILELFVNTLTTDDKYSSRNIQNLTQQLQTTMSQKQKTFYRIFITYVISRRSSDDFVQKDESTSLSIYEIIDAEKSGYLNV